MLFPMFHICHVSREANEATHAMANLAKDTEDHCVWVEEFPLYIGDLNENEMK